MKVLVAYKALRLPIFKVNVKILGKFYVISIAQYQYHYLLLLTLILHTYMEIKNVDNNQKLYCNNKEDRLNLRDIPLQKILED